LRRSPGEAAPKQIGRKTAPISEAEDEMTMAEKPNSTAGPANTIQDKAPKPKGVIPRNTQSLVIMGIAVLMILIMWLTGGGKNAARTPRPTVPTAPAVTPTDAGKIQDFKRTIQTQQRAVRQPVPVPDADQAGGI